MMKLPVILGGVAALVLLAAGYFFVLPMLKGAPAAALDDEGEPVAAATTKKKPKKAHEPGLIYPMPERVLNLVGTAGAPHYARIELAIEFEKSAVVKGAKAAAPAGKHAAGAADASIDPALEHVVERKAQIDDLLVRIIGTKTVDEMTTTEGREALKQQLLDGVFALVSEPEPTAVYIVRLIVQ